MLLRRLEGKQLKENCQCDFTAVRECQVTAGPCLKAFLTPAFRLNLSKNLLML